MYRNFPEMVGVGVAQRPLLRLDRYHPAFILTCKISYLKYISLGRRVKRIDFGRADLDGICAQLAAVGLVCFLFSDIVLFLFTTVLTRRTSSPGLIKLRNLDNIRSKSQKYMKGLEKIYIRPMTELQQYEMQLHKDFVICF
jgi:hypothetical protein